MAYRNPFQTDFDKVEQEVQAYKPNGLLPNPTYTSPTGLRPIPQQQQQPPQPEYIPREATLGDAIQAGIESTYGGLQVLSTALGGNEYDNIEMMNKAEKSFESANSRLTAKPMAEWKDFGDFGQALKETFGQSLPGIAAIATTSLIGRKATMGLMKALAKRYDAKSAATLGSWSGAGVGSAIATAPQMAEPMATNTPIRASWEEAYVQDRTKRLESGQDVFTLKPGEFKFVDGDSGFLADGSQFRITGMNTADKGQMGKQEAADYMNNLTANGMRFFDTGQTDRHGRRVIEAFDAQDNQNSLAEKMYSAGQAGPLNNYKFLNRDYRLTQEGQKQEGALPYYQDRFAKQPTDLSQVEFYAPAVDGDGNYSSLSDQGMRLLAGSAVTGGLNLIPFAALFNKLPVEVKNTGMRMLLKGLEQGASETATEIAENIVTRNVLRATDKDVKLMGKEVLQEAYETAALSFPLGFLLGTAGGIPSYAQKYKDKAVAKQLEAAAWLHKRGYFKPLKDKREGDAISSAEVLGQSSKVGELDKKKKGKKKKTSFSMKTPFGVVSSSGASMDPNQESEQIQRRKRTQEELIDIAKEAGGYNTRAKDYHKAVYGESGITDVQIEDNNDFDTQMSNAMHDAGITSDMFASTEEDVSSVIERVKEFDNATNVDEERVYFNSEDDLNAHGFSANELIFRRARNANLLNEDPDIIEGTHKQVGLGDALVSDHQNRGTPGREINTELVNQANYLSSTLREHTPAFRTKRLNREAKSLVKQRDEEFALMHKAVSQLGATNDTRIAEQTMNSLFENAYYFQAMAAEKALGQAPESLVNASQTPEEHLQFVMDSLPQLSEKAASDLEAELKKVVNQHKNYMQNPLAAIQRFGEKPEIFDRFLRNNHPRFSGVSYRIGEIDRLLTADAKQLAAQKAAGNVTPFPTFAYNPKDVEAAKAFLNKFSVKRRMSEDLVQEDVTIARLDMGRLTSEAAKNRAGKQEVLYKPLIRGKDLESVGTLTHPAVRKKLQNMKEVIPAVQMDKDGNATPLLINARSLTKLAEDELIKTMGGVTFNKQQIFTTAINSLMADYNIVPAYLLNAESRNMLKAAGLVKTDTALLRAVDAYAINSPEFDKLPARDPNKKTMTYAGVGSRGINEKSAIAEHIRQIAAQLEKEGYTLNTGDADGTDSVFRNAVTNKNVFTAKDATPQTLKIAEEIHPKWDALKTDFSKQLMARNTFQVFGENLDTPVDFVIAWTPDGAETTAKRRRSTTTGGTGQAIEMADRKGIPVINLRKEGWQNKLARVLEGTYKAPQTPADMWAILKQNAAFNKTDMNLDFVIDSKGTKYFETLSKEVKKSATDAEISTSLEKYADSLEQKQIAYEEVKYKDDEGQDLTEDELALLKEFGELESRLEDILGDTIDGSPVDSFIQKVRDAAANFDDVEYSYAASRKEFAGSETAVAQNPLKEIISGNGKSISNYTPTPFEARLSSMDKEASLMHALYQYAAADMVLNNKRLADKVLSDEVDVSPAVTRLRNVLNGFIQKIRSENSYSSKDEDGKPVRVLYEAFAKKLDSFETKSALLKFLHEEAATRLTNVISIENRIDMLTKGQIEETTPPESHGTPVVKSKALNPEVKNAIADLYKQMDMRNRSIDMIEKGALYNYFNSTPELKEQYAKEMSLLHKGELKGFHLTHEDAIAAGIMPKNKDSKIDYFYINKNLSNAELIATISHEVGHAVVNNHWTRTPIRLQQRLLKAWAKWLKEEYPDEYELMSQAELESILKSGASYDDLSHNSRFVEWMANNIGLWLTTKKEPKSLMERWFSSVAEALASLFNRLRMKSVDKAVGEFMSGIWINKESGTSKADRNTANYKATAEAVKKKAYRTPGHQRLRSKSNEALEVVVSKDLSSNSLIKQMQAFMVAYDQFFSKEDRDIIMRAVGRGSVWRQVQRIMFENNAFAAWDDYIGDPRLQAGYVYALYRAGQLDLGAKTKGVISKHVVKAQRYLGIVTREEQAAQMFDWITEVEKDQMRDKRQDKKVQIHDPAYLTSTWVQKNFGRIRKPMSSALEKLAKLVLPERQMQSTNPYITAMVDYISRDPYSQNKKVKGYEEMKNMYLANFSGQIHKIMEPMHNDPVKMENFVRIMNMPDPLATVKNKDGKTVPKYKMSSEMRKTVKEARNFMDTVYTYAKNAGVDFKYIKGYWPFVGNTIALENNRETVVQIIAKYMGDKDVQMERHYDEKTKKNTLKHNPKIKVSARNKLRKAEMIVDGLIKEDGFGDLNENGMEGNDRVPYFGAIEPRALKFLTQNEKAMRELAPFMEQDGIQIMFRYAHQAVKRAEYERIKPHLLELGKKAFDNGATRADINKVLDLLNGVLGIKGAEEMRKHPIWDNIVQGATVLTNMAILGTAGISNIADVGGVFVRSPHLAAALSSLPKGFDEKTALTAKDIGAIEESTLTALFAGGYDTTFLSGWPRKLNDWFFKAIGMHKVAAVTRTMGTALAERTLALWASDPKRFAKDLREVGIDPKLLKFNKDGSIRRMSTESRLRLIREIGIQNYKMGKTTDATEKEAIKKKVEAMNIRLQEAEDIDIALNRFINSAMLKPSAAAKPGYGNDARYKLFFLLKGFMYQFWDTYHRRAYYAARYDNNWSATMGMMTFLPIFIMVEAMRDALQHLGDDDPWKEQMSRSEWWNYHVQRSGLLGITEPLFDAVSSVDRGQLPVDTFAGPVVGRMWDGVVKAADNDIDSWLEDMAPLQNLWGPMLKSLEN